MSTETSATSTLRIAALVIALAVPALTLVPLGSLWLFERGFLLYWALGSAAFVGLAFLLNQRFLSRLAPPRASGTGPPGEFGEDTADPGWTPAESQAWTDVMTLAKAVDVQQLSSREAVLGLGTETVTVVARRLHPEVSDPMWQFTVPEAMAILEQVSRRFGTFTAENIPLGDRLTVAQLLALYRWRGAIDVADKAYDVWRVVRMINPLAALTNELRERLSKQMLQWGQEKVTERLAHVYVSEIGRAAIDLYGGRLRVPAHRLEGEVSAVTRKDQASMVGRIAEPLRILIAGQPGAGKSSLINALAKEVKAAVDVLPATAEFTPYELKSDGFPAALLIDSPGLETSPEASERLVQKALQCDLILWVIPAHRADRDADEKAIASLQRSFAIRPNRRPPPLLIVLSHIDKLRPFQDWAPPYDLSASDVAKAQSIRAAIDVVAAEFHVDTSEVVPVSLAGARSYNIDALWATIVTVLPDAERTRLVRRLDDARSGWNWQRIWSQAANAGRVIVRNVR